MEVNDGGKFNKVSLRVKDDFSFMLSKYAELFVNTDKLKKEILLEELQKFRVQNTSQLEIDKITNDNLLAKKRQQHIETEGQKSLEHYKELVKDLQKQLLDERKDKLYMMNEMVKAYENEKNTRIQIMGVLSNNVEGGGDGNPLVEELRMKQRMTQNLDDIEFYKARLLEKMKYVETETAVRHNIRNFNRRALISDQGITYYGNTKSLDHIYDIVQKIKKNAYGIDSDLRKTALEEIALYVQTKAPSFLRYFGFVDGVISSLNSQDDEVVQTSLFILAKLAMDPVLAKEIIDADGFNSVKQILLSKNEFVRILALAVYEPLCKTDTIKNSVDRKEVILLVVYLEEYLMKNIHRGCYLLWSIICSLSARSELRKVLIQNGCVRLISLGFDLSSSQITNKLILQTLKNLSEDSSMENFSSGEKVLDNLLRMIETANHDNLLIIIEILSYTAASSKSEAGIRANSKLLKKVLDLGIESDQKVKHTVLKVLNQLFLAGSELVGKINSDRIATLIYSAFSTGSDEIKESACTVLKQMIVKGILNLTKEPDLIYQVLLNFTHPSSLSIRAFCIDIIYQMTMTVQYLSLILLAAPQVITAIKSCLSLLHPEIAKGMYQNNFLMFDKLDIRGDSSRYFSVYDDDLVTHISSLDELKTRFLLEKQKLQAAGSSNAQSLGKNKKSAKSKKRNTQNTDDYDEDDDEDDIDSEEERRRKPNLGDLDDSRDEVKTDHLVHNRSHAFSDPSEFAENDQYILEFINDVVQDENTNNLQVVMDVHTRQDNLVFQGTTQLVKIINVMISCDIVYPKVMSVNFQALFGVLIEKSIGYRHLALVNAIFSFYSNLFDILLLRGNLSLTEPLREMAQLMADKFVVRVLKVLYKEVNNKFVNWNILCTTISLLLRILMKEETAQILLEFSELGKVLELIINKGLALKSSNILIMAALLSVHLSIYEELHQYILNREFMAFLMGLLEPGDSEFIEK